MTLPSGAPEAPADQSAPAKPEPQWLFRVEEFARLVGIGRTKAYALVMSGEVESVLIGSSRRVPREAVDEFVQRLRAKARGRGHGVRQGDARDAGARAS